MTELRVGKGEVIYRPGQPTEDLYCVLEGLSKFLPFNPSSFLKPGGIGVAGQQIDSNQKPKTSPIPSLCGRDLEWPAPRARGDARRAGRVPSCCREAHRESPCG
jgi:hypothetical protein